MRRLTGWIVAGILAAVVEFWWGPLRWVLYAAPGYVPDGQRTNDFAIFVVTLYFVRWRAVASAVSAICALLAGDVDFRRPRL